MNGSLPESLIEFKDELQRGITRELTTPAATLPAPRRTRRRGRIAVGAIAGGAVAAALAAVLVAAGGGAGGRVSAAQILRAAAIALPKPAPRTIVHISVTQALTPGARRNTGNTAAASANAEGWFQQGGEYRSVTRVTLPGGTPIWESDGRVYDAATRRLYVLPPLPSGHPRYTLTRITAGSYSLRVLGPDGPIHQTVSAATARGLRSGADQVDWAEAWNGHTARLLPLISPTARSMRSSVSDQPNDTSLTFAAQLHQLLESGRARVAGHVTIDSRAAIKIQIPGADGRLWMTYYVDPQSYRPIEYDIYGFGNPRDQTRLIFHAYQVLPQKGNVRLLRLRTRKGTTVDRNPTSYFLHSPAPVFW